MTLSTKRERGYGRMASRNGHYYDNGKSGGPVVWQVAVSAAIAVGMAALTAFWSMADPRSEIKEIKSSYLSLREHNEYRSGVRRDIDRLDNQIAKLVGRAEVEQDWKQRDRELQIIHQQIDQLRDSITGSRSEQRADQRYSNQQNTMPRYVPLPVQPVVPPTTKKNNNDEVQ